MQPGPRIPPVNDCVVGLLVVCLVGTAGATAAHQFVTFGDRPFAADAGETVEIPVQFHRTDRATVRIGETVVIDVRDDGDGVAEIQIDLAALGTGESAVRVTSGRLRAVTADPLAPGNYTLTVEPPTGVGDETSLLVTEQTPTTAQSGTPTAQSGTPTAQSGTDTRSSTDHSPTETTRDSMLTDNVNSRPSIIAVLAALLGPLIPVAALAVVSRIPR